MEQVIEKEKKKESKTVDKDNAQGELVVLNDDFNTFEHVIRTLKKYCGLDDTTAQVCTYLIHTQGGCVVMRDAKSVLYPICENLNESGLIAEVQDSEGQ
jgi:ATP-dependent Clp protease adaptor protein ClpS